MKKAVLKKLHNIHRKMQACNFIKKSLQHRCFPTAASVLTLFLSSNNLLTGYEQLSY